MAERHLSQHRARPLGKLRDREEIAGIARAAVLGVCADPALLLESKDRIQLLAVEAITDKAEEYRALLDEALANRIIGRLGDALGG